MTYDSTDTATRLAAVRTAIADILASYQSAGTGIKNVRKAELQTLVSMEKQLVAQLAAESGDYGFYLCE